MTVGKKTEWKGQRAGTGARERKSEYDTHRGGGRERSVNDMYTQTGRTTDQKEGKTARKTKRGKLPKELD